jgi:uncharacterized protein (UPF0261 family)
MARILVVGTADTKGEELAFLEHVIGEAGGSALIVDVGIGRPSIPVGVTNSSVASHDVTAPSLLGTTDRGPAIAAMGRAFRAFLAGFDAIDGIIGIGGGGGTSIITEGMRALPIGLPKLMVSTMASGDVSPYVDVSDITMMSSVTDLAGLNPISRKILRNAGFGIVGMARAAKVERAEKPAIGLTMFGVTTPCVTAIVEDLKASHDCLVFHATGTGGRAMEKLVDSGMISGVIDATTTEIADHLCGGVLSAGADRLGAVARNRIPYVGSVGACDMVNFQTPESVPQKYRGRRFYQHNPQVTLMRTTADECVAIGRFIAEKLNACEGQIRFLIPEGGVSMLDAPGQPFHDPNANKALFDTIESVLIQTPQRHLTRLPFHINAPAFSAALTAAFRSIEG